MVAVITATLFAILLVCSGIANAKTPYGQRLCNQNTSLYDCYKVHRGDTWWKLFPDSRQRDVAMRVNRMNIELYPGLIIAVPRSNSGNAMNFAPMPSQIEAPGRKVIYISLDKLAFGAYSANGNLSYWGPVSGAKGFCPDINRGCHTPLGKFIIRSKAGSKCVSTKYPVGRGGAPMPYCMFFHGGFALHGSYNVPGFNDSHGCIRLFVNDARWLNQEFTAGEPVAVIIN